jgi:hypothetical protein
VSFNVAVHFPFVTTAVAFTGAAGATVKTESKSVPIDMYATDFLGRKKARLEIRKRAPIGRADRTFINLNP